MTASNSPAYTIKNQNRPGPAHFNHDPTMGWVFFIMGTVFFFVFVGMFSYSGVLETRASIAGGLISLFVPVFLMSLGGLAISTRTRWAFQKRNEAHNALSLDVAQYCHKTDNVFDNITVSVHPSKRTKGGAFIDIISMMLNDLFGFQKLKSNQTPAYNAWLKSHFWLTRFFLTFWICPAPFQIVVHPLSAHQKIGLMAKSA